MSAEVLDWCWKNGLWGSEEEREKAEIEQIKDLEEFGFEIEESDYL